MPTRRTSAPPIPYVVDANFFLQAHKVHYPMDVIPGFWSKVSSLANQGRIISIDKVHDELYTNPDVLSAWIDENCPADFFKDTNPILAEYGCVCATIPPELSIHFWMLMKPMRSWLPTGWRMG
jgi:hypothetical protein